MPSQPTAVEGDAAGNVFVTMETYAPGAPMAHTEVWKFDAGGHKQWSVTLPNGWWGSRQMAVMSTGDLALGACSVQGCYSNGSTPVDAAVLRLSSADGHVVWRAAVYGSGFSSVSADGNGHVLAVTMTNAPNGSGGHAVLIAEGGGILLDHVSDLLFTKGALGGTSGDFVLAGQDAPGRPAFERWRPDGSLVFHDALDAPAGNVDRVAFAPNGSIALAGWFRDHLGVGQASYDIGYTSGFLVVASGDGSPQWSKSDYELATASTGVLPVLRFGRDNDVVVFTMTFGKGTANLRSYTRDGALNWRYDFRGIYGSWVNTVGVSRDGDVLCGVNGTADQPFQALRYPSGTQFVAAMAP